MINHFNSPNFVLLGIFIFLQKAFLWIQNMSILSVRRERHRAGKVFPSQQQMRRSVSFPTMREAFTHGLIQTVFSAPLDFPSTSSISQSFLSGAALTTAPFPHPRLQLLSFVAEAVSSASPIVEENMTSWVLLGLRSKGFYRLEGFSILLAF